MKTLLFIIPLTTASAFLGLKAFLGMYVVAQMIYWFLSMRKSCSLLSLSVNNYLATLFVPIFSCIISGLLTLIIKKFLPIFDFLIIELLFLGGGYFLVYFTLLIWLDFNRLIAIGKTLLPKNVFLKKLSRNAELK